MPNAQEKEDTTFTRAARNTQSMILVSHDDKICTVLHSNSRHFTPTHCSKSMKGRTIPGVGGIVGCPKIKRKRAPSPTGPTETLPAMILVSPGDKICTVLHSNSRHFTPTHCSKSMKGRTIPGVGGIIGCPMHKRKRTPRSPGPQETLKP